MASRLTHFLAASSCFVLVSGVAVAQTVTAMLNGGPSVTIGSISSSNGFGQTYDKDGKVLTSNDPASGNVLMTASFQLADQYKYLMNDTTGCQFRWFQIVTADSAPPNWMGKPPTVPYVDPPSGGWDYQRSPKGDYMKGTPGDDDLPFYENNAEYAKDSEKAGSGGLGHNAAKGITRIFDQPGVPKGKSTALTFETFLAFETPALMKAQQIDVLAGFSWGGGYDMNGKIFFTGPTTINPVAGEKATMTKALGNDGFGGWKVDTSGNIDCSSCKATPEPVTMSLIGGAALLFVQRRRKQMLAKA